MSRYDWPPDIHNKEHGDDPAGRAGFLARRRTDFDPIGAREAGRAVPVPRGGAPGPFAPPSGRDHLWQPLGPMTVLRGQATGDPRIAGRVNALAVDTTGTRIYAASGNGGIWYSSDGGAHWKSLGGFAPTNTREVNRPAQRNSCGTIHVVFGATEADDNVFVGTGEAASQRVGLARNAQPGISLGGIGILFAHGPAASANADPWQREADNLIGHGVNAIAIGPDASTVVAATSNGLFQRPSAPGVDVDWVRVAGAPFSSLTDECTDVLWTAGAGARPERLWVWVRQGDKAGLWVRSGTATDFTKVTTPGALNENAELAASVPPDQIFLFNDDGGGGSPILFRIAAATAAAPVATVVAGVPDVLQGQGFYDLALAVHPTLPDRVVLGGCNFSATTPDGTAVRDGAVVIGDIALVAGVLTFTNLKMISVGVHSDVHDVVYSNAGGRIWVSCDGGVYRSNNPTTQAGFFPCNDGLSIIEANYVANHPTCEGYIVTGLQDNGVIERLSNGVWRVVEGGDGGSVIFDPILPTRFISQYVRGIWRASDGSFKWNSPNNLLNRAGTLANDENTKSAFYSTAAGTKQTRGANVIGQIIAGSTRLWYTENFGAPWPTAIGPRWVTLPTGTDPLPGNSSQDDFGEKITVCRWQSPDVAWVLGEGKLMRYARTPGSDAAGGPGTWAKPAETIIKKNVKNKKDATSADGPIRDSSVWTDIAVNLDPPAVAGGPGQQHGTKGALYLGTIGNADNDDVDTLWWFDGTSKWFKTLLRKDRDGNLRVPAPVTAIVCDPAFPNEVYVGTTVGVWKGVRTQVGNADPEWDWQSRVNGLPEAAVEDLAIFSDGSLRLLRAAIAARGTWELRLDVADVADLTYVRVHNDDLRYRVAPVDLVTGKRVLKQRDLSTDRSWHGSPDVRPRVAPAAMPVPTSLTVAIPWQQSTFTSVVSPPSIQQTRQLRRFQAALRSKTGDPRVRPTGVWDSYFNEVLRDLGSPLLPAPAPPNTVCITKAFWDATMSVPADASAEPWGTGIPLEADLYDFVDELKEGDADKASCSMPRQKLKVDILVHHRGLDPVDGAKVRVTLLWWADPKKKNAAKWNDAATWFAGNVGWTPAVNQVLNSADGKTTQVVDAGWKFALGNTNQSHRITLAGQTLHPTHSGVATFDLDVSSRKANSLVLLVAIIHVDTIPANNIALAPATLQELTLTSPNVAVRSIRISP
jgi:hypothetical protein